MAVATEQSLDHKAAALATKGNERRAAAVACGAHALHDGYTDLIYVLLPVWQKEFGLGYGELGVLKALFSGTMAGFQIPSSLLAERLGAPLLLALGTALSGIGYCVAGASAGIGLLMVALFGVGLGSSTQHPLASSLMAQAFAGARSMKAIGTYNFAGDIGKITVPATASLLLVIMAPGARAPGHGRAPRRNGNFHVRPAICLAQRRGKLGARKCARGGATSGYRRSAVPVLISIGMIDSATRMGFLLFLPFVLTAKGASLPTVGLTLTLGRVDI